MGFAEPLGVVITMKDVNSTEDERFARWLHHNGGNRCFEQAIPRANAFQTAAHFSPRARSYWAKYPGAAGRTMKMLCSEILQRLATLQPPATLADVEAKGVQAFCASTRPAAKPSGKPRSALILLPEGQRGLDGESRPLPDRPETARRAIPVAPLPISP
jgi:hypothetical protein